MRRKLGLITSPIILLSCLVFVLPASAGAPTDQVRGTVDNITAILKNPAFKTDAKKNERRDQLRQAIFSRFDFTEMAKRSLGTQWRKLSAQEQEEFVRLFTDLLERAYIDQIEAYNDEKFVYVKETVDQDFAEVQSRIVTPKGEYSLNYRLHLVGSEWKVYDVVVENISLVNNYRSQFSRIIANQSYEELVRRMKSKQIQSPTPADKK
ncbi:MAG TPA: ABC transporter substrate-binding protein [Candidatus Binatia bacterium]|jgi:phospholipid transport system substrate-binding protein